MAVQVETIAVSSGASTRLSAAADTEGGVRGQTLTFTAPASPLIYLGPAGVTTGTGYPAVPGQEYSFELGDGEVLHAIAASGTPSVVVLRTGV